MSDFSFDTERLVHKDRITAIHDIVEHLFSAGREEAWKAALKLTVFEMFEKSDNGFKKVYPEMPKEMQYAAHIFNIVKLNTAGLP